MNQIKKYWVQLVTICLWAGLGTATPRAGGPLYLCGAGTPFVWPNGGVNIPFNPDQGNLGPISHDDAVALVQSAFDVWADVPTATTTYVNAGELSVDVDISNFGPFLNPAAPDGLSAIVFDDTGEIFDLIFGAGSGILGFAGPEWVNFTDCSVLEGVCFLNGPAFTDPTYARDVMVHEFGHYSGLAHTVVNGQIYIGDTSGPTPDNATFGAAPDPFVEDVVETMYPFYFGSGVGSSSLEKDDVATISALYPEASFTADTGTIRGTIRNTDGASPLTGVNVIARNLADPFGDAVSTISGDLAVPGIYALRGLTPGAEYAIYVDQILAGGFSTPLALLPNVEEFYNGANESTSNSIDPPLALVPVSSAAGSETTGIDILFNRFEPGENLPVGDDRFVVLTLPFPFTICGQTFQTVAINANGNLTFGGSDGSTVGSPGAFLSGLPRIAALWTDLNPAAGGTVTYEQTATTFRVHWKNVPLFPANGANTFSITLQKTGNVVLITYGKVSAPAGLAGLSGGFAITSGLEAPVDLRPAALKKTRMSLWDGPAIYEVFNGNFDLANQTVRLQHDIDYNDRWAGPNDTLANAKSIALPFNSSPMKYFTEIEPAGGDVDYFKFHAEAGQTIVAATIRGAFDTTLGLFGPAGDLIAVDDDSGPGVLSLIKFSAPETGEYAVAVSAFDDLDFNGDGFSGGRYILEVELKNCGSLSEPGPANWLVNGSFETADFTGWFTFDIGTPLSPWAVADEEGFGFFHQLEPQDGCFVAFNGFDGCPFDPTVEPMLSGVFQEVTVPAGEPSLVLEWQDRVEWDLQSFGAAADRVYAVAFVDPATGDILEFAHFLTAAAGTTGDTGWVSHSFDASAYIGQTVGIYFLQVIPECFSGPGQFQLDNVRLRSE